MAAIRLNIARAANGAGRMTQRLSFVTSRHWLLPADPVQTGCGHSPSAPNTMVITSNLTAVPKASNALTPVSDARRTFICSPDVTVATTFGALSP